MKTGNKFILNDFDEELSLAKEYKEEDCFSIKELMDQCVSQRDADHYGKELWDKGVVSSLFKYWDKLNASRKKKSGEIVVGLKDNAARLYRYLPHPSKDRLSYLLGKEFFKNIIPQKQSLFAKTKEKLIPYGTTLSTEEISEYYREFIRGRYADWIYGLCINPELTSNYIFDVDDGSFIKYMLETNEIIRGVIELKRGVDKKVWDCWEPQDLEQKEKLKAFLKLIRDITAQRVCSRWEEYKYILSVDKFDNEDVLKWFVKKIIMCKILYFANFYSMNTFLEEVEHMADMGIGEIFHAVDCVKTCFKDYVDYNSNNNYLKFRADTEIDMNSKTKIYKEGR